MSKQVAPIGSNRLQAWAHALKTCGPPPGEFDGITRWLVVTRACVQPMTLTSVGVAGLLAARHPAFDALNFALAAVGAVVAHAANNMINDYFDTDVGLDRADYPRALYAPHPVLSGWVSQRALGGAILACNAIDAAVMLILWARVGWPVVAFALGGLFISVFYVAPPLRLKSHGLGEPGVFLVWGPLMVGGTYYSATGTIPSEILWACVPYALLVASVLMGKHIDKAPWDEREGVRTLPVILGDKIARSLTLALMAAFYVAMAALIVVGTLSVWCAVVVGALPLLLKVRATYSQPKPDAPPEGYPLWPLWFVSWAFVHTRRAGALFLFGLALGAIWPRYL